MPAQAPNRRRRRILTALGVTALLIGSNATTFMLARGTGEIVSNPEVEFRDEAMPTATPTPAPQDTSAAAGDDGKAADGFIWAHYGYTLDRRRYLPLDKPLEPPFKKIWQYQGKVLLEFSPVLGENLLFLLNDYGRLVAIDKETGKLRWRKKLGTLAAASPAYADGTVYVVLLTRAKTGRGRFVSLDAKTGKIKWAKDLASRSESSPLYDDGKVYFGTEDGTVYALDGRTGKERWRFRADGAVKGAVTRAEGKLFLGDYGGRVYALNPDSGRQVWRTEASRGKLRRSGNFYSTPAVAFGRVYIGNTDGRMYSFSVDDGELAWSAKTGGYVYASPAVAKVPGGRPLVYAGSYDGRFYAFDARTGAVRWFRGGNGRISGGATVIGDIVYYADLGKKLTIGLDARSGRKVFEWERGSYNPVISDGEALYVTGYHALYGLVPLSAAEKRERRIARIKREARAAAERKRLRKAARVRDARRRGDRRACDRIAGSLDRSRAGKERAADRCFRRRREKLRSASRSACAQIARSAHKGSPKKITRSYRTCIRRRGVKKRR